MELSSGIPRDIDLTERGSFRQGAPDLLHHVEYKHGELPWYSDGKLKNPYGIIHRSRYFNNITDDDLSWDDVSIEDNIISNMELVTSDNDLFQVLPLKIDEEFEITEDPKSLIPYIKNSNIYIYGDSVIASSLFKARFKDYEDDVIDYADATDFYQYLDFSVAGSSSTSWRTNISNQIFNTYSSSTLISDFKNLKFNLTPEVFRSVHLSKKELSGKKLICGKGDELKLKLRKMQYLEEVRKLLIEYKTPDSYTSTRCTECGRIFVNNILGYKWHGICPECQMNKSIYYLNHNSRLNHFDRKSFHDFHGEIMRGKGFKIFDNEDGQLSKSLDTIDYYRQCRYDDRGRFLVQLPRRSHELEVELESGLIEDDEPDENRRWGSPQLYFSADPRGERILDYGRSLMLRLINSA